MNTCILIHFAVGILSAIFGYLLGRLFGKKNCNDCENYDLKIAQLEAELKACKNQKITTQKRSIASNAASAYVFDRALAKTVWEW